MNSTTCCNCKTKTDTLRKESTRLRKPGLGYNYLDIHQIFKLCNAKLPSKIYNGTHHINWRTLAEMLGNSNDRNLLKNSLSSKSKLLIEHIGFCQGCIKSIPIKLKRETPDEIRARHIIEIETIFRRHPQIIDAKAKTWTHDPGFGFAEISSHRKKVFSAKLFLIDGTEKEYRVARPGRCKVDGIDANVAQFAGKNALWNRIKNINFLDDYLDIKPFIAESDRKNFENEIRTTYSNIKNIHKDYIQVKLFTINDVVDEDKNHFKKSFRDKSRHFCEIKVVVPGNNGQPTTMLVEHVSMRDLKESPRKKSVFEIFRENFIKLQKRHIKPITDYNYFLETINNGKSRRKIRYSVGSEASSSMYKWEIFNKKRNPKKGYRFIGLSQVPHRFLILAEIYNQTRGIQELKWCLVEQKIGEYDDGKPFDEELNVLLSVIESYRDSAGTPTQVRKNSNKCYYQVRSVICYISGDGMKLQEMDTIAKKNTKIYATHPLNRRGQTEFRAFSSMKDCVKTFEKISSEESFELKQPLKNKISWDYLIGREKLSPLRWIQKQYPLATVPHAERDDF